MSSHGNEKNFTDHRKTSAYMRKNFPNITLPNIHYPKHKQTLTIITKKLTITSDIIEQM